MNPSASSSYRGTSWHVQYSSRKLWEQKRNAHLTFTTSGSLEYSFQELGNSGIKTHEEKNWKVVAEGKDGRLGHGMKEVDGWIEDSSGEARADWRSRWVAVAFPFEADTFDGVDVLCNRQKRISDEMRWEILDVLKLNPKPAQIAVFKGLKLLTIPDDGARDAETKAAAERYQREWEWRTGKDVGISEDLVYDDDEEEKESSRCGTQ